MIEYNLLHPFSTERSQCNNLHHRALPVRISSVPQQQKHIIPERTEFMATVTLRPTPETAMDCPDGRMTRQYHRMRILVMVMVSVCSAHGGSGSHLPRTARSGTASRQLWQRGGLGGALDRGAPWIFFSVFSGDRAYCAVAAVVSFSALRHLQDIRHRQRQSPR